MLGGFFKSNNKPGLQSFLQSIKKGERDFFKILKTSGNRFDEAPFEQLMSNKDDVLSGVNRVQMNFKDIYFDIFDSCLVKHYDNGNTKLIFFTETSDAKSVMDIAGILFNELGKGFTNQSYSKKKE